MEGERGREERGWGGGEEVVKDEEGLDELGTPAFIAILHSTS